MSAKNRVPAHKTILLTVLLVAFSAPAFGEDVTLVWDPNTEVDLAGYKVYYGTASGVYASPVTISVQTTYTIKNLSPGTYFFAVTAYNTAGRESGYSNEVTKTVAATSAIYKCDLNGDSLINVLDLQILINAVLGTQLPANGKGDLNGDGRVDALDLQVLGNVILGIRSCPL